MFFINSLVPYFRRYNYKFGRKRGFAEKEKVKLHCACAKLTQAQLGIQSGPAGDYKQFRAKHTPRATKVKYKVMSTNGSSNKKQKHSSARASAPQMFREVKSLPEVRQIFEPEF